MKPHFFVALVIAAVLSLPAIHVAAQTAATTAPTGGRGTSAVPRTPDGRPDLQGTWDFRTVTPLERPAEFANKAVLTEAEVAEYERRTVEARNADANREESKTISRGLINGTPATADVALAYNDFWWDRGTRVVGTRRTSLVVDPPDGRVPSLTPQARERVEALEQARERPAEGPEDRSGPERCILGFNSGPPMIPGGYNQNIQIVQTPDHVMILNEMVHSARIVLLDGSPHGNLPQLVGTSRGRWDGDTLVVDTRNFLRETSLRGSSASMHLIERFTRTGADTLLYEFTVDDPTTWTRRWTAEVPMVKTDDLIFEYACHEANYGMTNLLKGARAVEQAAVDPGGAQGSR